MADETQPALGEGFLGRGWSFPPRFDSAGVVMREGEDDIRDSLNILFRTGKGERAFHTTYGLDIESVLFEPLSTTMTSFLEDRIRTAILRFEPRIRVLDLRISSPQPGQGSMEIGLEYEVRATNSRFNLVFPFYRTDSNELRDRLESVPDGAGPGRQ
ncbi:MAG: GPW/gp25 family protein [Phycisphaerales bacterium]